MNTRLYLRNSYLTEFETAVTGCEVNPDREGTWLVSLEETAFYPESGGQGADIGSINGSPMIHAFQAAEEKRGAENESIVHVVECGKALSGRVSCSIDRPRRLSNMQQHTGQHILSRCFTNLCDAGTVSSRLGASECTIDIDLPKLSSDRMADVEEEANRIVRENIAISARNLSSLKAGALPLRKMPDRKGKIRIVEIKDFDWAACGGTHLARTGETGLILLTGAEKYKGRIRVSFLAGGRAAARVAAWRSGISKITKKLSCGLEDIPANYTKMLSEKKSVIRSCNQLIDILVSFQLAEIRGDPKNNPALRVIEWGDVNTLRRIASSALEEGTVSIILVREADPSSFVVAAGEGAPTDLLDLLNRICERFGCRGGGNSAIIQGTGLGKSQVSEFVQSTFEALHGEPRS